jgi:two-component system CheB/CheR fusion protein
MPATSENRSHTPIVAIGASAGGLEALQELFSRMPARSGFAFVVIQHLAAQHDSMLASLVGRSAKIPVGIVADGLRPAPDHVYVIGPGTMLEIANGQFRVRPVDSERREPIDVFFKALADDLGPLAVGMILSGAGADGTAGLRAILEAGGLTVAQAPGTASHEAMPRSAIDAGVVQHVLAIPEIPARLLDRAKRLAEDRSAVATPAVVGAGGPAVADHELMRHLGGIYQLLQRGTGHDFSHYKHGTVLRRLGRRLHLRHAPSPDAYVELLTKDPQEVELLAKDLLIGVTGFFRDPEAFEYLERHVLPAIFAAKSPDEGVRIWVPGCASGEEAYSIGMLVREQLDELNRTPPVQIFATDIDGEAIAEARAGRYSADAVGAVSPARFARFFKRDAASYLIAREVREMCIFSEHSLIRDPPFLAIDLISCRNVLIYLDAELQKRLVPVFHATLRPRGFLFLGSAEVLAGHPELFEVVDKRLRVFRRLEPVTRPVVEFPLASRPAPRAAQPPSMVPPRAPINEHAISAAFERLMLQEYVPPGAVVTARGDLICVVGLTGRYLQPPAGVLTTNILDIAHTSLRIELRTALHASARSGHKVVKDNAVVEIDGATRRLRITVRPLHGIQRDDLFAVVLQEQGVAVDAGEAAEPAPGERESQVEQLESELRTTRNQLRATIEELEAANQELKSSNEDMLSTNQDMQSSNEELQSSQEELRSVNEELATVNAELGRKLEELARANGDLQNLFSSTDIATVFLDCELRVTRFTPAAKSLFRLIEADVGRPLFDLAQRFVNLDLPADVASVLRTLRPLEHQVETVDRQACFLLRVLPYHTVDNAIAGAVITLTDITQVKRAEAERERLVGELREARDQLTADLEATNRLLKIGAMFLREGNLEPILGEIMDAAIATAGADFGLIQIVDPATGELRVAAYRGFPAWWLEYWKAAPWAQTACGTALRRQDRVIVEDVERDPIFTGAALEVQRRAEVRSVQSTPLLSRAGAPVGVLSTHSRTPGRPPSRVLGLLDLFARQAADIVERKRAELELGEAHRRMIEADRRKSEFLAVLSHELRNPLAPIRSCLDALDYAAPEPRTEQERRAYEVIRRQFDHLTRLVDDLLDVTRITSGKISLQREILDLSELARHTVEDHRDAFVRGGIALALVAAPAAIHVHGDRARLTQAVGNLLHNAAKFTPRGGTTTVSIDSDPTHARAFVRVTDSGRGIAPEVLPRLFEPFTQVDIALDRQRGGLGLGLAVAKGLVELHGGSVTAASDGPGTGSIFTIALPREAGVPTPADVHGPGTPSPSTPRRVLVIEDNVDAANALRNVLELAGHQAEVAYNGPDGVERARASVPDVVFCDIGLPTMDGYEVARTLRAQPELGRIKLVAVSGYGAPEDLARAREAGFDLHVTKPVSIVRLEEVLAELEAARSVPS